MRKQKFDRQALTMAIRKVLDRIDEQLPGLKCHGLEAGQRYPGDLTGVTRKKLIAMSPAGETQQRIFWPFRSETHSKGVLNKLLNIQKRGQG